MSVPDHETGTVASGDVTLFYRRFGRPGGTPILIVHGLSYFSYDWLPVAGALASGREAVAMDMRGFGDSTWSPSRAYAVADFAGDCIAVADSLGWDRFNLMGHSMGGRNGVWCAAENPGRVTALILCDYTPRNAPAGSRRVTEAVAGVPDGFASVDEALAHFGHAPPVAEPVRRRMEAYLAKTGNGFAIKRDTFHRERFRRIRDGGPAPGGPDMWEKLSQVRCPTLVVRGTRSDMFGSDTVDRVKAAHAALELVEIEAGHDLAGDAPDALVAEVKRFLEERP